LSPRNHKKKRRREGGSEKGRKGEREGGREKRREGGRKGGREDGVWLRTGLIAPIVSRTLIVKKESLRNLSFIRLPLCNGFPLKMMQNISKDKMVRMRRRRNTIWFSRAIAWNRRETREKLTTSR